MTKIAAKKKNLVEFDGSWSTYCSLMMDEKCHVYSSVWKAFSATCNSGLSSIQKPGWISLFELSCPVYLALNYSSWVGSDSDGQPVALKAHSGIHSATVQAIYFNYI